MLDGRASAIPRDAALAIRLLVLDVDGVLTSGGVILGATKAGERVEMKRFDIKDGLGIRLLQDSGVEVAIITGRESKAVALRAAELGITECHQDPRARKLQLLTEIVGRRGLSLGEVAFMGDDLPDIPALRAVGLATAPADAAAEVRAECGWIASRGGGRGAVRELAEALLRARGEWASVVARYLAARAEA